MAPSQCPVCGNDIKKIPAGVSRKTGKPYNEFYACSDRSCDFTYREPRTASVDNSKLVMDELVDLRKEINDRLDAMAEYIAKMSGELKDRLDDVYRNTEKK